MWASTPSSIWSATWSACSTRSGVEHAAIVGHDWGAPVAWHAALLRPDRFDAVAALSVHWGGIAPRPTPSMKPTDAMRAGLGDSFLYILYFQEPGIAESELDLDLRRSLRCILYTLSGDIPRDEYHFFDPTAKRAFDILVEPPGPLDWLSDDDLDVFVDSFAHHGTFFGGLNWYRCIDATTELLAPFAGRQITQPALFIGAEYDSIFGQTPEAVLATRRAHPQPPRTDLGEGIGTLDPAGRTPGGQRSADRLPPRKPRDMSEATASRVSRLAAQAGAERPERSAESGQR